MDISWTLTANNKKPLSQKQGVQYQFVLAGVRGSRTHLPRSSRGKTE